MLGTWESGIVKNEAIKAKELDLNNNEEKSPKTTIQTKRTAIPIMIIGEFGRFM